MQMGISVSWNGGGECVEARYVPWGLGEHLGLINRLERGKNP